MKKLLVIGGSGLVGSTLIEYAKSNYDIHFTINKNESCFDNIPFTKIDLMKNKFEISNLINNFNPDVVIHTAAHSSVDLCETDHKLANFLHIDVTQDIARVCHEINAKLIYFSTDAVFDGKMNKKYLESDTTNPINYYGKTKLDAEKIILQNSHNLILRTTVIYGWHTRSRFTNWVLDSLKNKKTVTAFTDQFNTPTLVDDLAKSVFSSIEKDLTGVYHASGKSCLNRFQFAQNLAKSFDLDQNLIVPTKSSDIPQIAPRPKNGCLDCTNFEQKCGIKFSEINSGIDYIFSLSNKSTTDSNKV